MKQLFTVNELILIEIATRLRAEACEENGEHAQAEKWRAIIKKCTSTIDALFHVPPKGESK